MPTLTRINKRLHVCSYHCLPHKNIHCMPVTSAPEVTVKELQEYNASRGRNVLSIREALEADIETFRRMVYPYNPTHTKCWLVTLYATLVSEE